VTPLLRLENVALRRGGREVLRGVSGSIERGERVALLGLNGSGKTSLLFAIAGLIPHTGSIEVSGIRVSARTHGVVRNQLGFVFAVPEDQLLLPTVLEDVSLGAVVRGVPRETARARALAGLAQLGVLPLAERSVHELSHGERTRVALAGALIQEPPLLLLDEPSLGLDPPGRRQLADQLTDLPSGVLVATHDLPFARRTCTRFVVIEAGRWREVSPSLEELGEPWLP
jgi:cobalt/nickel transport system ATP-binding protein